MPPAAGRLVRENHKKGVQAMTCELCGRSVSARTKVRTYGAGIWVGQECGCYGLIQSHCNKPYSKVMDRLAMVEAGYYANRKLARLWR